MTTCMRGIVTGWVILGVSACGWGQTASEGATAGRTYPIVDTGQRHVFSDRAQLRAIPGSGRAFHGQDAFYEHNPPRYRNNADGTVSDLVTGLMWVKTPDLANKKTFPQAVAGAAACRVGGHDDWRLPTIKELYSLIDFNGCVTSRTPTPYIDTKYFDFRWGDERTERKMDAQYFSATEYVGTTMRGAATVFGVNFADGRIKGYPRDRTRRGASRQFVRYVRGNPAYGVNRFVDNRDGTISDLATGLMWAKADSGRGMNWQQALAYCEGLTLADHGDWRLPNAKELQSIVDYTRAPDATDRSRRGPAIDPIFRITKAESYFWTGTTHLDGRQIGAHAVYIAFGQAFGYMTDPRTGRKTKMNVHGAGAQRSDPKAGNPADWPSGFGPQGDDRRILNYARPVRNIDPSAVKRVTPGTARITHVFSRPISPDGPGGRPPQGRPGRRPPPPRHRRP